jgi:hypothetical protein
MGNDGDDGHLDDRHEYGAANDDLHVVDRALQVPSGFSGDVSLSITLDSADREGGDFGDWIFAGVHCLYILI